MAVGRPRRVIGWAPEASYAHLRRETRCTTRLFLLCALCLDRAFAKGCSPINSEMVRPRAFANLRRVERRGSSTPASIRASETKCTPAISPSFLSDKPRFFRNFLSFMGRDVRQITNTLSTDPMTPCPLYMALKHRIVCADKSRMKGKGDVGLDS